MLQGNWYAYSLVQKPELELVNIQTRIYFEFCNVPWIREVCLSQALDYTIAFKQYWISADDTDCFGAKKIILKKKPHCW